MSSLGNGLYRCAQITTTDRSYSLAGVVVKKDSNEGKQMRLKFDSFICLSNILIVKEFAFIRLMGYCPIIDELIQMCKTRGIQY
jgi:hypothetical protein